MAIWSAKVKACVLKDFGNDMATHRDSDETNTVIYSNNSEGL